jgi:hypothetical protein
MHMALAAIILFIWSGTTLAAEPAPGPKGPGQPPTSQGPQLTPPAPPSKIDPGIQKQPDTVPNLKSVVPPPVVDPNMAIDPEKPRSGDTLPPHKSGSSPSPNR